MGLITTDWLRNLLQKSRPISPAVIALVIQLASFCVIGVSLIVAWRVFEFKPTLNQTIISQAVLTLLITRWFHLAWWWCVIQPLFPIAAALMLLLPLPPVLYLLLFLLSLAFYWSTYRTQVPYYPSTKNVWLAVDKLLPTGRPISFVDIGSGLGGLVLYLARRFENSKFLGVEIAPLPWLLSYLRVALKTTGQTNQCQFLRSNYETLNFSEFDVVFAYLSPAAMNALWIKAKSEMRPGSMLISYEFPVIGVEADLSICIENKSEQAVGNENVLYVWNL